MSANNLRDFVQRLFESRIKEHPDRIAVVSKTGELTYAELNERANRLAWHLLSRGIAPGSLVPVCTDRSADMAVGVLGVF
jgi:non-ribosomal peptide synthetase component F